MVIPVIDDKPTATPTAIRPSRRVEKSIASPIMRAPVYNRVRGVHLIQIYKEEETTLVQPIVKITEEMSMTPLRPYRRFENPPQAAPAIAPRTVEETIASALTSLKSNSVGLASSTSAPETTP